MSLETEYLTLMPDTVTVYPLSSLDDYGKRAWSATGTSYRCRIQDDSGLHRTPDGREVVITGKAYLYGSPALTTNHKIVLPDGTSPIIVYASVNNDESGSHHTLIRFGK